MATALNLGNANGKTITLRNPDTNNSDITVEMDKVVVKDSAGNVGIGGGSSIYNKLEVAGAGLFTGIRNDTGSAGVIVDYPTSFGRIISRQTNTSNYSDLQIGATNTLFVNGGFERGRFNSTGDFLLTSGNGALGYGTGAGGTVTQATSKATAVTLNKPTGIITMNNAALAAGASVEFTLNNSLLSTTDLLVLAGSTYSYNYTLNAKTVSGNAATIRVTNVTAGNLSETLDIKFAIIKGANA